MLRKYQVLSRHEFISENNNPVISIFYGSLGYEKENEYEQIRRMLLLFNLVSVMQNGGRTQWFPFYKFKESQRE